VGEKGEKRRVRSASKGSPSVSGGGEEERCDGAKRKANPNEGDGGDSLDDERTFAENRKERSAIELPGTGVRRAGDAVTKQEGWREDQKTPRQLSRVWGGLRKRD